MEGSWSANGGQLPACDPQQQQPGDSGRRLPMPTVHDALPFTPLPSIVPFSPDMIQPPTATPVVKPTAFSNYHDVNKSRAVLDQLSVGATNAESASRRCQQSIRDVQRLLDPSGLTPLTFKKPLRTIASKSPVQKTANKTDAKLSPFAKMVLDNTSTSFSYLTPEHSPEPQMLGKEYGGKTASFSTTTPQSLQKPTFTSHHDAYATQGAAAPTSSQHRQVSAVVPEMLSDAQRAEYQYMPDPVRDQHLTPSKLPSSSGATRAANLPPREKTDLALTKVRNLLADIFQKEDQMQPGAFEEVSVEAAAMFEMRDTPDGSKLALQANIQSALDSAISSVVSNGRLGEVDADDLQRTQRLCEAPIASIDALALSIGDDWIEQDIDEWKQRINMATHGLCASRTITQIMEGCAHLKELQSEGYLSQAIDALSTVSDRCIIPLVVQRRLTGEKARGEKGGAAYNPVFATAAAHQQDLHLMLNAATRAMRSLRKLLIKVDVEDSIISKIELMCTSIIFAENAASDKDSAISVQVFGSLRHVTMDVYANLFTKYAHQRASILTTTLGLLEKLPATKQSARQYRPQGTKPIQLVSALLMRLVQTSATRTPTGLRPPTEPNENDGSGEDSDDASDYESPGAENARQKQTHDPGSLRAIVAPLHDVALRNAHFVASKLLDRAAETAKSSDEPYRKLLDIFTEDFLNVLGSSDWPAAEMLLRALVTQMIRWVEDSKRSVPSRTLALELLGVIGSGIMELQISARQAEQGMDASEEMASHLKGMVQQSESGNLDTRDVVALNGPYRMWAEYLDELGADEDALLQSARGYILMQWAHIAAGGRESSVGSDADEGPGSLQDVHAKLREMLLDPKWLDDHSTLRVGTSVGRLAVLVATLNSTLCRLFPRILNALLTSVSSEQPTLRSRSLRSMNALLDKDASLLDRFTSILGHIYRCLQDKSALVRDSALTLLQKCVTLKPKLHTTVYSKIAERTRDNNTNVRKRALKMLRETYLRNRDALNMRSAIVDAILLRLEDTEASVIELARATMEEVWFLPFHGMRLGSEGGINAKLALYAHAGLVIATVDRDDKLLDLLEALTKIFTTQSKSSDENTKVCRALVAVLFDGIIDNAEIPGSPSQTAILRTLTVFAKATPTLFTAAQLERVEPYTKNLNDTDESGMYRYVITILRHVMPTVQHSLKRDFVQSIQTSLLKSCTRLRKTELREVAPCLWTINGIVGNTDRLVNFLISVLIKIRNSDSPRPTEESVKTASRLMPIASEFGNACDLDAHLSKFTAPGKCDWYKGDSVSGLIVETLCSFTGTSHPLSLRQIAIDGICTVAVAWPKQFLRPDVIKAFERVFREKIPETEGVLLSGLESFFRAQEAPEEITEADEMPKGIASGTERLGRTYVASDTDGASTSLAQRFLNNVLEIALASCTEPAFTAARLVVSVNKQGLVHPKDSGPALVALETCPERSVASAAFKEHKAQHQKHETVFEKAYMRAVQQTFDYQSKVVGDAVGFVAGETPSAKMHLTYEVLKTGRAQVRKKFLANISQKMDFDMAKLALHDLRAGLPSHLALVRFCCENLALFDYDKVEDLLHLLTSLEKIFSSTGSTVAQAVESDILKMQVDNMLGPEGMVSGRPDMATTAAAQAEVEPGRLYQLCVSAQILSIIWETRSVLRKVWNMQKHTAKGKGKDKDASKAPSRSTHAPNMIEAYLKRVHEIMGSAASELQQRAACRAFVELISVDSEVKVASDHEDNIDVDGFAAGYDTPSEGSSRKSPSVGASGGGKGRKRKASVSTGGTPKKRARPRKSVSFNASVDGEDEDGGWD